MSISADVRRDLRHAVARIQEYGLDGPRPIEEIEALLAREEELDEALTEALGDAEPERAAALIHLVGLLRRSGLVAAVRGLAFETASPPEAKREAADLLRRWQEEIPATAVRGLERVDGLLESPGAESLDAVLDLPREWSLPAIEHWLATAGEDDVELARRCLGRDAALDRAVLTWLGRVGSAEAATVVQGYLETGPGPGATKEAKRALHRLRSQGIEVREPEDEEERGGFSMEVQPRSVSDALAHASSIDGEGARLVWILLPSGSGGHRLLEAVVSDLAGLQRAEVVPVTRKGYRSYLERVADEGSLLTGRIDTLEAARLVEEAAGASRRRGDDLPSDYLEWRDGIGKEVLARAGSEATGEAGDGAPVELVEPASSISGSPDERLIEEAVELLNESFFATWALRHEAAQEAARRIRDAETSSVMVNEEQRKQQAEAALADAARAFDSGLRATYRRRLEIMADLLERHERDEDARRLRAAARGIAEITDLYRRHAFARALVQRGVLLAYRRLRSDEESRSRQSRIIRP